MDALISDDDLMTPTEAAKLLRVTLRTIYRYIDAQTIPYTRVGGRWRFSRHALTMWLQVNSHTPVPSQRPVGSSVSVPIPTHLPSRHVSATHRTDEKIEELRRIAGFGPRKPKVSRVKPA